MDLKFNESSQTSKVLTPTETECCPKKSSMKVRIVPRSHCCVAPVLLSTEKMQMGRNGYSPSSTSTRPRRDWRYSLHRQEDRRVPYWLSQSGCPSPAVPSPSSFRVFGCVVYLENERIECCVVCLQQTRSRPKWEN